MTAADLMPYVERMARRHNPPQPLDADDLVQEAMLAILHLERKPEMGEKAWTVYALMRARGAMIDAIRRDQWGGHRSPLPAPLSLSVPVSESDGDPVLLGDVLAAPADDLSRVHADELLAGLGDADRVAVEMAAKGHTRREIGEALGVTESAASLRMIRLRRRIESAREPTMHRSDFGGAYA